MTFYQICCNITDVVKQHVCIAQLDRALGYGPRCRGFESSCARDRSCLNYFRQLFVSSKQLYNSQILFIKKARGAAISFIYIKCYSLLPRYSSTFSDVSSLSRTIVIMIIYRSTSFNISSSNCDFIFSGYACTRKCTL